MSGSIEAPVVSTQRQEFEKKIAAIKASQEKAYVDRVVANENRAKTVTEKLLREFKAKKDAEEKLLSNPDAFYVPEESKFFVVIQIRSSIECAPKPRKTLEVLRLGKINRAVIVRNNKCIKNMLKVAKDYIAYGSCNYETLRKLVYSRGFGKINGSKVKLNNESIEDAFEGKYKCVEELVDVIYNGKEDITKVCNFLYPFGLAAPAGGFRGRKAKDFVMGGSTNNHMELIGELLERML